MNTSYRFRTPRVLGGVSTKWLGIFLMCWTSLIPLMRFGGWEIDDTEVGLIRNPSKLAHMLSLTWNFNQFGYNQTRSQSLLFPVNTFFWIFSRLGIPPGDRTQLWLGLIIAASGFGCWWLLAAWIDQTNTWNQWITIIAAIGFANSSYVIQIATDTTMFLLPYAMLPWLVGVTIRLYDNKFSPRIAVGLIAIFMLLSSSLDLPSLIISISSVLSVGIFLSICRKNTWSKFITLCGGIFLGLLSLAWSIIPTAMSYFEYPQQAQLNLAAETTSMYDSHTSPAAIAALRGYWALYSGYAGRPYRPYQAYYLFSFWGRYSGYILLLLALIGVFALRENRFAQIITVIGVITFRLAVGTYPSAFPPGSSIVIQWVYSHVPLATTFRDTYKFMLVFSLVIFVLAAGGLALWANRVIISKLKLVGMLSLIVAITATAWPVWHMQLWWPDKGTQLMPPYWQEASNWINDQSSPVSARVLMLPDVRYPVYSWGIPPTQPSEMLINRWQVFPVPGTQSVYGALQLAKILNALKNHSDQVNNLMSVSRIRYILLRGDMLTGYYPGTQSSLQWQQLLAKVNGIKLVNRFGPLLIYRYQGSLQPLISCYSSNGLEYKPTHLITTDEGLKYSLNLNHVGINQISLAEAYDPGWTAIADVGQHHVQLKDSIGNGYENSWRIPANTTSVEIVYSPSSLSSLMRDISVLSTLIAIALACPRNKPRYVTLRLKRLIRQL